MATREDIRAKLKDIIGEWGFEFAQDLVVELRKKDFKNSGGQDTALAGSIRVYKYDYDFVQFEMADYWIYPNYGTKPSKFRHTNRGAGGKSKKIESIENWILEKGGVNQFKDLAQKLKLRDRYKDGSPIPYEKKVKTLAFIIANIVAKNGTIKRFNHKGAYFVEDVLKIKGKELEDRLLNELGIEIEVSLIGKLKDGNK